MVNEDQKKKSILLSIKHKLGLDEDDGYDDDIIIDINSALSYINDLGIGPKACFSITGPEELWTDFLGNATNLEMVKSLVYLKVKLVFDPPTLGFLLDAINKQIAELEYRLYVRRDNEMGGNT